MANSHRMRWLITELADILGDVSGQNIPDEATSETFFDLGLDSLLLTQAAQAISRRFRVKLKLRQVASDYPSCQLLAGYLDATIDPQFAPPTQDMTDDASSGSGTEPKLPPEGPSSKTQDIIASDLLGESREAMTKFTRHAAASGGVHDLVRQQLALMARQLEVLARVGGAPSVSTLDTSQPSREPLRLEAAPADTAQAGTARAGTARAGTARAGTAQPRNSDDDAAESRTTPEDVAGPQKRHGPQLVIDRNRSQGLTPTQEKHLDKLTARYLAKTKESRAFTERVRSSVSDPRTVAGFKPRMKEIVYPIVVERSQGCHLWDVDGNEYVDLVSGYGSNFFGFGAPFVKRAVSEQMDRGMEIGPQSVLVEEVASLFRHLTKCERIGFCNTGSEAVLATLRMARTATNRDLVVMFSGGYHGIFDEVVVRPGKNKSLPAAPGIPRSATENILVLPWAEQQALDTIRERGEEIAAVLVEPVQSRAPEIQPEAFLKELRDITRSSGSALIFDEVVCGFRIAPGGAQEYFGIEADLASYGKIVGGGLSIGVVGGRREFMDTLDGGHWDYGDDSIPEVGVTYFAGTFVRHPVHLAAARAVLAYMKEQGPELQRRVNSKAEQFATRVNQMLKQMSAPVELKQFSSILKLAVSPEVAFPDLLHYHLRERGVHIWDGRPCFITDAHSEADLEFIQNALESAVRELQEAEFYPKPVRTLSASSPPAPGARLGRDPSGKPTWYVPDPDSPSGYRPLDTAS